MVREQNREDTYSRITQAKKKGKEQACIEM